MSSLVPSISPLTFALLLITTHALPLHKRSSTGAKAGMGIGIAVAAIIVVLIFVFLFIHFRRARHIAAINRERAILAGEKNADGTDKIDKYDPRNQPTTSTSTGGSNGINGVGAANGLNGASVASEKNRPGVKRNKSVKDRLMGPLYRGSTIDLMPLPKARVAGQGASGNRGSTMSTEGAHWDNVDGQPFLHKPWQGGESSPRPSFSSKRATRMMMMM